MSMKAQLTLLCILSAALRAETGYDAWLRYAPLQGAALDRARL